MSRIHDHRDQIADAMFACMKRMWITPDDRLLAYMREQNKSLIDWLDERNRLLAAEAGEQVEPKAHQVHAVLTGSIGGGI
jgi:hypothetical protein